MAELADPALVATTPRSAIDPVTKRVADWMYAHKKRNSLMREWQDTEHRLSIKISPLGMSLTQATRGGLPEARMLRSLSRRIGAIERKPDRATAEIVQIAPCSVEGAIAKIELGLCIQGAHDWEENSYCLIRDGIARLRELTASA